MGNCAVRSFCLITCLAFLMVIHFSEYPQILFQLYNFILQRKKGEPSLQSVHGKWLLNQIIQDSRARLLGPYLIFNQFLFRQISFAVNDFRLNNSPEVPIDPQSARPALTPLKLIGFLFLILPLAVSPAVFIIARSSS